MNTKTNVQLRAATAQRFWLHRTNRVAATGLALICLTLPLRAAEDGGHKCSNATLKGDYGALISGIRGTGPMLTEMFAGTSLRNYDGAGRFTETTANQLGAITGTVVNGQATGSDQVNHDCTGTSTVVLPPRFPTIVSSFISSTAAGK